MLTRRVFFVEFFDTFVVDCDITFQYVFQCQLFQIVFIRVKTCNLNLTIITTFRCGVYSFRDAHSLFLKKDELLNNV